MRALFEAAGCPFDDSGSGLPRLPLQKVGLANNNFTHRLTVIFLEHDCMNAQMRRRIALQIAANKHGLPIRFVDGASESIAKRITASEVTRTRSRRTRRTLHAAAVAREQQSSAG